MAKLRVVSIREETPAEAELRKWFAQQVTASPANLEEAARQIIGLVTALLGVLFGVVALTEDKLPAYLQLPVVRWLSVAAVALWLLALLAALGVVLPRRWTANPAQPASQAEAFDQILRLKSAALTAAAITFWLGVSALGGVLVVAILSAG